jgi:hypothetical protein
MPPNEFNQPSMVNCKLVSIIAAQMRTIIATAIIITINARNGSQAAFTLTVSASQPATSVLIFTAAANPIKTAKKEKLATTRPFFTPLKKAKISNPNKQTSIIIKPYLFNNAFTDAAIAFPSALPANCFEATPITLPKS